MILRFTHKNPFVLDIETEKRNELITYEYSICILGIVWYVNESKSFPQVRKTQ